MKHMPLIALAERLYRALLSFYPSEYRDEYGEAMVQIFRDVSHFTYQQQGYGGILRWWGATLFDLFHTVIEQRKEASMSASMLNRSKLVALISFLLCVPLLFMFITASFNYEPAFVQAINDQIISSDGYTPTTLGRIVMLALLFSPLVAFAVNLSSMLTPTDAESPTSFKPTLAHTLIGVSILLIVLIPFSKMVLHELNPFVDASASIGRILFLVGLMVLPVAFLLNLLPRLAKAVSSEAITFQPTSINLIIGAVILLIIIMIGSTFMLETLACSSGVPNCD